MNELQAITFDKESEWGSKILAPPKHRFLENKFDAEHFLKKIAKAISAVSKKETLAIV